MQSWPDLTRTLRQLGIDPSRQNAIHLDIVLGPCGGQTLRQLHDAAFRGGVRGSHVKTEQARHRTDRENLAAAAALQLRMHRQAGREHAGQVGGDNRAPLRQHILLRLLANARASVGNEDVNPAERGDRFRDHRAHLLLVGHIRLDANGAHPQAAELLDGVACLVAVAASDGGVSGRKEPDAAVDGGSESSVFFPAGMGSF